MPTTFKAQDEEEVGGEASSVNIDCFWSPFVQLFALIRVSKHLTKEI